MRQIFVFCYHKSGTNLLSRVLQRIGAALGLRFVTRLGLVRRMDAEAASADIVLFAHSLIAFDLATYPHRGVRLVRDPRAIWVSGYFYHRRCTEDWCINADLSSASPIRFPKIPYSQEHRPEQWKRDYLSSLNGRSYQENLQELDRDAGLRFEAARYAKWTAEAMAAWRPDPDTIDVKLESFAADFDDTMNMVLRHLGFSGERLTLAQRLARAEDVARMSDAAIGRNPYITSRNVDLWRQVLTGDLRRPFETEHAALLRTLGYDPEIPS